MSLEKEAVFSAQVHLSPALSIYPLSPTLLPCSGSSSWTLTCQGLVPAELKKVVSTRLGSRGVENMSPEPIQHATCAR